LGKAYTYLRSMESLRLLLLFIGLASATDNILVLTSFGKADCSDRGLAAKQVLVKLNTCLNNHDFTQVSCNTLSTCLSGSGRMTYEDLVTCTKAPRMLVSVNVTVDSQRTIAANIHSPMTDCTSLGFTSRYKQGDCASTFAFSSKCGFPGVRVNTTSA